MKKLLIFLMILAITVGTMAPGTFAEENRTAPAEERMIAVEFGDPGCAPVWTWEFPYSDEWFLQPDNVFNREMAKGSIGLVVSAYKPLKKQPGLTPQYEVYLSGAGFENIYTFGYDQVDSPNTFAGCIAQKKIGEFTIVAVAGRGSGYSKEWGGNLEIGTGTDHEGFRRGADILKEELDRYLQKNPAEGQVCLWVVGYSRSSASGNLAAAEWTASGRFDRVYAYFFACPRVTTKPVKSGNIFNICGSQDFVTQVPMQCYGYERNGTDLFLPSAETTCDYGRMKTAASETARKLTGLALTNNPEFNLFFRMGISLLSDIFQTREEYTNLMQERLISAIPKNDVEGMTAMLPGMIVSALGINLPEDRSVYISSVTQLLTRATLMTTLGLNDLIQAGIWDPETDTFVNLTREHLISTYISWIFSELPDEEILRESSPGRILFLNQCTSLTLSRAGEVQWVLENGAVRKEREDVDGFVGRFNGTAVVMLPTDGDWQLTAESVDSVLRGIEIMLSPDKTFCDSCVCYLSDSAQEGAYEMTAHEKERLSDVGNVVRNAEAPCGAADLVVLIVIGFTPDAVRTMFDGAFGGTNGVEQP